MKPPEAVVTWDEFKERFRNTHVPDSIMEREGNLRTLDRMIPQSRDMSESSVYYLVMQLTRLTQKRNAERRSEERRVGKEC